MDHGILYTEQWYPLLQRESCDTHISQTYKYLSPCGFLQLALNVESTYPGLRYVESAGRDVLNRGNLASQEIEEQFNARIK